MTIAPDDLSPAQTVLRQIRHLPHARRIEWLNTHIAELTDEQLYELRFDWRFWARPEQLTPNSSWTCFVLSGGRGSGKTRPGCEAVREAIEHVERIALVSPTAADARDTIVEGESGLQSIFPATYRPIYEPTKRKVTFHNGAKAFLYSGEEPDRLRGPQHGFALVDELCFFKYPQSTWDNLLLGLRLGHHPRVVVATTPRAIKVFKDLIAREDAVVRQMSTYANRSNLPEHFYNKIIARYEGTRLGRSEIHGELLEDVEGAMWTMEELESVEVKAAPNLVRTVIGIDPSTGTGLGDECGIMVMGLGEDGVGYVLADLSIRGSPGEWGRAVARAYESWHPDRVVCEEAFGQKALAQLVVDPLATIPWTWAKVHQAKDIRAEPIKSLYEQGKVKHVGRFPHLEEQMCLPGWTPILTSRGWTPIHSVQPGDEVLTRNGWAPVEWAGVTAVTDQLVQLDFDGGHLYCTVQHLIWTTDGYVTAANVQPGQRLLAVANIPIPSRGEDDGGISWTQDITARRMACSSIAQSGKPIEVQSRLGNSSITSTTTLPITDSRISRSLHRKNIAHITMTNGGSSCGRASNAGKTLDQYGHECRTTMSHVLGVEIPFDPTVCAPPSAPSLADAVITGCTVLSVAPELVFDLKVADGFAPEFIAGGVLVHNCTWVPVSRGGKGGASPDRLDALVTGMTELMMVGGRTTARIGHIGARLPSVREQGREQTRWAR